MYSIYFSTEVATGGDELLANSLIDEKEQPPEISAIDETPESGSDSDVDKISDQSSDLLSLSSGVPEHFTTEYSTYVSVSNVKLGDVNLVELSTGDLTSVIALLQEHRNLTGYSNDMEIEFVDFRKTGANSAVRYRQSINGIPVERLNKVTINADGQAIRLFSLLLRPDGVGPVPSVLEAESLAHAVGALSNEVGEEAINSYVIRDSSGMNSSVTGPTLYYGFAFDNERPSAFWKMYVVFGRTGESFLVVVDAESGETRLTSMLTRG